MSWKIKHKEKIRGLEYMKLKTYTSEITVRKIKVNEKLGIWLYPSQLIDTLFLPDKEAL